jgi:hypothetical protein
MSKSKKLSYAQACEMITDLADDLSSAFEGGFTLSQDDAWQCAAALKVLLEQPTDRTTHNPACRTGYSPHCRQPVHNDDGINYCDTCGLWPGPPVPASSAAAPAKP